MEPEKIEQIKDVLKTLIVAISDGSIVSNTEDYIAMIDQEL